MLPFWLSIGCLGLVQAALVAAPRPLRVPALEALRNRWMALVPPLSIAVVIGAIALDSASAKFLTYLALVAVPPLAAVALGAVVHGARPPLAMLVPPLFAIAWGAEGSLWGHTAALALSALANVTLGWLLAAVVPRRWLELGIYAMAAVDTWLVASDLLQAPNAVLNTAAPAANLPHLQLAVFGSAVIGFGDLFIAATLGAVLAENRALQLRGAALVAILAVAFDFLFFAVDQLPATVPVAVALGALRLSERRFSAVRR